MDGGAQPQRGERGETATGSYRLTNYRTLPEHHSEHHKVMDLVVGFGRLRWLSHDGMIRGRIMACGAQPPRAPILPSSRPG